MHCLQSYSILSRRQQLKNRPSLFSANQTYILSREVACMARLLAPLNHPCFARFSCFAFMAKVQTSIGQFTSSSLQLMHWSSLYLVIPFLRLWSTNSLICFFWDCVIPQGSRPEELTSIGIPEVNPNGLNVRTGVSIGIQVEDMWIWRSLYSYPFALWGTYVCLYFAYTIEYR